MHLTDKLLSQGHQVIGLDSLSPSYGGDWSYRRAEHLLKSYDFHVQNQDILDIEDLDLIRLFEECDYLVHLSAWAGVRNGQKIPYQYSRNNISGFSKILNVAREINPKGFFYASSSSVYGDLATNGAVKEECATGLNLRSYYAATKWINETEARANQSLISFPTTALRFFTIYGPWGRPDMAYWNFLESLQKNTPVSLYGETGGSRNFTYIEDAVDIILKLLKCNLSPEHRALNIACDSPVPTLDLLLAMAKSLKIKSPKIEIVPRPNVDVEKTWADLTAISRLVELPIPTSLESGTNAFVDWRTAI
jgi:UDP-glucuronate 4-epimerase